jgi:hypothetical protein
MIVIDAPGYVPFEPRTDEHRELRAELRRRLGALQAGAGEILWATFAGRLPHGADVENALFYNLSDARAFARSMANGVGFEFDPTPPQTGVRYTYEIAPSGEGFRCWRLARELTTLDAELRTSPTLASIWWALRANPASIRPAAQPRRAHESFTVMLDVEGPATRLTPTLIKTILDGIICALQSQTDSTSAAALAPIIARGLNAPAEAVAQALTRADQSAVGVRARLVHARSNGVQWTPDDDRCVAARLSFKPARRWHFNGTVTVAEPRT